jgi:hypothetical protein
MLTDRHGQYARSELPLTNDKQVQAEWSEAIDVGLRVCERMQADGYFGPVGIDAMRFHDEANGVRMRPIQEINARWTMGRLAYAWRRYLPSDAKARWLLQQPDHDAAALFTPSIATSPITLQGRPTTIRMSLHWG